MSGTISTKSFSFFILISLCQRDTEYIEYQGPSALDFILVYPEHPTSEYTTQGIDLWYRLNLSRLQSKAMEAVFDCHNVEKKCFWEEGKTRITWRASSESEIQNAHYGEEKASSTASIPLENTWKMDVIRKKWGIKPNTFFVSVQLQ